MDHKKQRRIGAMIGLAALGAAFLLPVPAHSQARVCFEREGLARVLKERFGEAVIARGLTSRGQVIELFRHPQRETWTMVMTDRSGRSCVLFAGEAWQQDETPVETGRPL